MYIAPKGWLRGKVKILLMKYLNTLQAYSSSQAHRKHLSLFNDKIIGTWKGQNIQFKPIARG